MSAPDFPTLYKFNQIETAIQTLAQARGMIWLTAKERSAEFQSERPRVDAVMLHINPFGDPPPYIYDINGNRRIRAWTGVFELTLITEPNYDLHWSWRSVIADFMATLDAPTPYGLQDDAVNLPYHEVSRVWDSNNNIEVKSENGAFWSKLQYNVNFNIRTEAWPGGITNA